MAIIYFMYAIAALIALFALVAIGYAFVKDKYSILLVAIIVASIPVNKFIYQPIMRTIGVSAEVAYVIGFFLGATIWLAAYKWVKKQRKAGKAAPWV